MRKFHPRGVTGSGWMFSVPTYQMWARTLGESHTRKCVDCSDPAYSSRYLKSLSTVERSDLNHPPTSVGGILKFRKHLFCRLDLNNPPTPVGGIPALSGGLRSCGINRILSFSAACQFNLTNRLFRISLNPFL